MCTMAIMSAILQLIYFSVYVMLADFYEFEGLLNALHNSSLLDTGEYVVVGADTRMYDSTDPQKYIDGT